MVLTSIFHRGELGLIHGLELSGSALRGDEAVDLGQAFGAAHLVESTDTNNDGDEASDAGAPDKPICTTIHRIALGLSGVDRLEVVADIHSAEEVRTGGVVEETENGGKAEEGDDGADDTGDVSGERVTEAADEDEQSEEEAEDSASE